ncbi:MAG: response regulator [Chloroflexi bacterium]|nr:response regulator [Chloroflexota bacterium]MDK1044203.1 response regulator [Anaerolineales bacterium]MCH8340814.1 response regulator [Chloroflexota bacterium]MCI0772183.1 response regulator [Chloroflexota bacterium]MCI0805835.1 response regulator [Chloroflexota bacterium]
MRQAWIIDDDDEMNHAVRLMLELLDFEVLTYRAARPAAKMLLDGRRPDLIVLDINMPEVTGMDFLEFLGMRAELKGLPVIMLSTEASDVRVNEAMKLGASGFVSKPVTIEELETVIAKALPEQRKRKPRGGSNVS